MKSDMRVRCSLARRAISAALDGEATSREQLRADAHLAKCSRCRAWADSAVAIGRKLGIREATQTPDLAPPIAAARAAIAHAAAMKLRLTRLLLLAMAGLQTYLTVPVLLSHQHAGHHLAAFDLALACGVAYAAWRPARSVGILPFLVVLAIGLFVSTGLDAANGETHLLSEIPHILVLLEGSLIWRLQRLGIPRSRPPRRPSAVAQTPDSASQSEVA